MFFCIKKIQKQWDILRILEDESIDRDLDYTLLSLNVRTIIDTNQYSRFNNKFNKYVRDKHWHMVTDMLEKWIDNYDFSKEMTPDPSNNENTDTKLKYVSFFSFFFFFFCICIFLLININCHGNLHLMRHKLPWQFDNFFRLFTYCEIT